MKQRLTNQLKIWRVTQRALFIVMTLAFLAMSGAGMPAQAQTEPEGVKNIVLVHGAWADASSWSRVIQRLQDAGYNVTAPQFPLTTMEADLARLRQVLAVQDGPTIVVGHSFGGQIISALGADEPNVVGLVYVAAFGLDEGETIGDLFAQGPPTPALANLRIDELGFAWIPQDDFVTHFAAGVDEERANIMYAVQQPASVGTLEEPMVAPAWKTLPSWFVVAEEDQVIPPDAQRFFAQRMGATVLELESGHLAMATHPSAVTEVITDAAEELAEETAEETPVETPEVTPEGTEEE